MRLRNLFFVGFAAAALFVACDEKTENQTPSITLSETSVEFGEEASKTTITVTSTRDWVATVPASAGSWLTVTPESGSANETYTVEISVKANMEANRSANVEFNASLASETLKVSQSGPEGESDGIKNVTVAEFIAAPDDDSETAALYRLTGTLTYVRSRSYGNVYIEDKTGSVYAYGLCSDASLTYQSYADIDGLTVGDVVTIVGKKTTYNNVVEVVDCYYESHVDAYIEPVDPKPVSIADFLAAEVSYSLNSYYQLTGTITQIEDATNGNIYIQDEAGDKTYIYGLTENNQLIYQSFGNISGLNVGDVITVIGCRGEYNSSAQMVNGYYVSHVDGENPGGGEDQPVSENPWTLGTAAYTQQAIINDTETVDVLKLGKSKDPKSGTATLLIPAGTVSMTFYAVSWKNTPSELVFSDVDGIDPATITPAANDGATGNPEPAYIISVTDTDKFTITFATALSSETTMTVTSESRNILWGFEFISE